MARGGWQRAVAPLRSGLQVARQGYVPRAWSREGVRWPQRLGLGAVRRQIATEAGLARYVEVGDGPPVVLLHGLDGSSRWWAPTLTALATRFRCLALEFVSFDRWRERGRVALPQSGAFVAAWLAALGIARADLVGHSMGGYTACQLAIDHPALVGRLALVAPAVATLSGDSLRDLVRFAPFLGSIAPGFAPTLLTDTLRTGPLRWLRSTVELARAAPLELERIAAPTLLLWGEYDPLVPSANAAPLLARIPGARLTVLPAARHVPMYEAPVACNAALAEFLGEHLPPAAAAAPGPTAVGAPPGEGAGKVPNQAYRR